MTTTRSIAALFVAVTAGWGTDKVESPDPLKAFNERVKAYVKLHKQAVGKAPKLKDKAQPEEMAAHTQALAAMIRNARAGAKVGDIFTADIKPHLLKVLRNELAGRDDRASREAIQDGNPRAEKTATPVKLQVNAPYPKDAPLSTVPPALLLKLPPLPEQLEYRFVGRHLILRDVAANLIVDYLPEMVP